MVNQSQKRNNLAFDYARFATRKCTEVLKIKCEEAGTLNLAPISQVKAIIFNTFPGNTDAFSRFRMSLKFPSPPFTHIHFHFLTIIESSISHHCCSSSNNMAGGPEVAGDNDCSSCCVGCIVMLQDHTSRHIICLGCWSDTLQAAECTVMRKWKWLFVTGCEL